MQWYEQVVKSLKSDRKYSHKELADELKALKPDLHDSTYHWAISSLIKHGRIEKLGYNMYSLPTEEPKKEYYPVYSDLATGLIDQIQDKYPLVTFTVFETVMMNEFLNHLIAQNTVFVQVEKEVGIYIFRFLQENGYPNVMYKPRVDAFDLYWKRDCIVITDLITEAPLRSDGPHVIMLEKILVDMCADKLMSSTFSEAEFPDIMEQAQSRYHLDVARLLRYSRRRNRETMMKEYLERGAIEGAFT